MNHSHYFKDVSALSHIDVYRVLALFGVTDPCVQHAVKKLLVSGGRGAKDASQDIREAIDSLQRYLAMREEEGTTEAQTKTSKPQWQFWEGKRECPVLDSQIVEIRLREGLILMPSQPSNVCWKYQGVPRRNDIVAYRVVG